METQSGLSSLSCYGSTSEGDAISTRQKKDVDSGSDDIFQQPSAAASPTARITEQKYSRKRKRVRSDLVLKIRPFSY